MSFWRKFVGGSESQHTPTPAPNAEHLRAEGNVAELISAISHKQPDIRRAAIEALGAIADSRAVDRLVAALQDGDLEVRLAAVSALGRIGDGRAVGPLVVAAAVDYKVAGVAGVEALHRMGGAAVEPLLGVLKLNGETIRQLEPQMLQIVRNVETTEADARVGISFFQNIDIRKTAVDVLGRIGDPRAVEPLVEILEEDREEALRAAAMDGRRTNPAAVRNVIQIRKALSFARSKVVAALGEIGDARARAPLAKALRDPDEYVRKVAGEAIKKLGRKS